MGILLLYSEKCEKSKGVTAIVRESLPNMAACALKDRFSGEVVTATSVHVSLLLFFHFPEEILIDRTPPLAGLESFYMFLIFLLDQRH
jgi:hypothetical protein